MIPGGNIMVLRTCARITQLLTRSHHQGGNSHAVVIGCYKANETDLQLTSTGTSLQNTIGTNILDLLNVSNFKASPGSCRSFYNLHADYPCITVAGLGDVATQYD